MVIFSGLISAWCRLILLDSSADRENELGGESIGVDGPVDPICPALADWPTFVLLQSSALWFDKTVIRFFYARRNSFRCHIAGLTKRELVEAELVPAGGDKGAKC